MNALIIHLVGDYITQSEWMAANKSKRSGPCLLHVLMYTLPFLFLTRSWIALLFIASTHFVIDRFGLARYLVYLKNHLAPKSDWSLDRNAYQAGDYLSAFAKRYADWEFCSLTGYQTQTPDARPIWLIVWLTIMADNCLHLICNQIALLYL